MRPTSRPRFVYSNLVSTVRNRRATMVPGTPLRSSRPSVQIILSIFVAVFMCNASPAQDAKVRASLESTDQVWVGQQVTLVVELLAPGYFASAATFELPDPQGVLLLPPTDHPVVGSETIDDTMYTSQRHELFAYPMRAGEQSVPPVAIRFSFKRTPLDTNEVSATVTTAEIPFSVNVPPGAENLGQIISARNLKVDESWQPEPSASNVEAGAAFTRTITFTAPDVPGMLFPLFVAGRIDGVGIYTKQQLRDESDRGSLQGGRRDIVTYVCQRPGQFEIPAASFTWFDLETQTLQTTDLPARTLKVVANPALASTSETGSVETGTAALDQLAQWWKPPAVVVALALLFVAVRKARTQRALAAAIRPFLPVHLQPLNPTSRQQNHNS